MSNEKGVSLLELIVSIGIMGIVLAALFNLFSTSYAASNTAKSKFFIDAQQKIIAKQLDDQFSQIASISNFPNYSVTNNNQNSSSLNYDLNDPIDKLMAADLNGNKIEICKAQETASLTIQANGKIQFVSEPCVDKIAFYSNSKDKRFVMVRIVFHDPAKPNTNTPNDETYIYQEVYFARNMQRM